MAATVVAANNPLLNPNATLSGNALLQAAKGLASAQTQPAIQQLLQEIAQNNRQSTGAENLTGGYFNQLGQQAQQGLTAEQGIQSGLNSQLQGLQGQENSQLQGIGNNAMASLQSHIPAGDYGAAGSSALASEIARQQGLAAQNQGAANVLGAQQGANYSGLAASNLGTFGLKGQEDLNQIAQAGQVKNLPLTQKIGQENAAYGADLSTAIGKLRQQEITNQATDAGLGIKQQTANATTANANTNAKNAATNVAKAQTSQQSANTTAQNDAFQNNPGAVGSKAWTNVQNSQGKAWSDNPNAVGSPAWARTKTTGAAGSPGATKPLTANEQNTWYRSMSQVEQLVKDGQAKGLSEAQIKANLQDGANPSKKSFDATMIEATYELEGWGHITPQTAAALHGMGLRGGTFNGAPIKVAPAPTPVQNAGNAVGGFLSGF